MTESTGPLWYMDQPLPEAAIREYLSATENVKEMTASKVYIPLRFSEAILTLRLFNTDPKNWNVFMFPYDAQKLRREIDLNDLIVMLSSERTLLSSLESQKFQGTQAILPTQCEIKKSKTSGVQTLYIFVYEFVDIDDARFSFERLDLQFRDAKQIEQEFSLNSKRYATNVKDVVARIWTHRDVL